MLRSEVFVYIFVSLALQLNVSEATTSIMIEPSTSSFPDGTAITDVPSPTTGLANQMVSSTPVEVKSTQTETGSQQSQTFATVNPTSSSSVMKGTPTHGHTTSVDTSSMLDSTTSTTTTTAVANTISPSKSTTVMASSSTMKPMPKNSYQKCLKYDNDCKNNGDCLMGQEKICVCKGNFYGSKCEKEGNPIFKPLVYALGGTCGFLLLVICISLICSCKNSNRYKTSEDLDSFNNIGLRAKGVVNNSYGDS